MADDTLFQHALATACAYWTLASFEFYDAIWQNDSMWGIATVRQRALIRLESLARMTEAFAYLQALGTTACMAAERLRAA